MPSSSKNFKSKIQIFQNKISEEYLKLSNLCFELANYFSHLITLQNTTATNQLNKEKSSNTKHETTQNQYTQKKRQRQVKSSKKFPTKTTTLHSSSKSIIMNQGSGKVIKVE